MAEVEFYNEPGFYLFPKHKSKEKFETVVETNSESQYLCFKRGLATQSESDFLWRSVNFSQSSGPILRKSPLSFLCVGDLSSAKGRLFMIPL